MAAALGRLPPQQHVAEAQVARRRVERQDLLVLGRRPLARRWPPTCGTCACTGSMPGKVRYFCAAMKAFQPFSKSGQLPPAAWATAVRASSPSRTPAMAVRRAGMPPWACSEATAVTTSAKASEASSAVGSLAIDGCMRSKLMSLSAASALASRCCITGGRLGAGGLAPAALEELGQPLLQPDRRLIARQRRDHVVHQLVRQAVQPGVAVAERARAGGHQPRPLAQRDGAGALHLGLGQVETAARSLGLR